MTGFDPEDDIAVRGSIRQLERGRRCPWGRPAKCVTVWV